MAGRCNISWLCRAGRRGTGSGRFRRLLRPGRALLRGWPGRGSGRGRFRRNASRGPGR